LSWVPHESSMSSDRLSGFFPHIHALTESCRRPSSREHPFRTKSHTERRILPPAEVAYGAESTLFMAYRNSGRYVLLKKGRVDSEAGVPSGKLAHMVKRTGHFTDETPGARLRFVNDNQGAALLKDTVPPSQPPFSEVPSGAMAADFSVDTTASGLKTIKARTIEQTRRSSV